MRRCESAGHGKSSRKRGKVDPGAIGSNRVEATLVRSLALGMAENAAAMKIPTLFRDTGIYYLADDDGVKFKADCFREWHFDAASSKEASGCSVLVGPNPSTYELKWAKLLAAAISKTLGIKNRGVHVRADLAVLRQHKTMQSVLVEVAYMTNKKDIQKYESRRWALELAVVNVDRAMMGMKALKTMPRAISKWRPNIKKYLKKI